MMTEKELFTAIANRRYLDFPAMSLLRNNEASDEIWIFFFIVYHPDFFAIDTDKRQLLEVYKKIPLYIITQIRSEEKGSNDIKILKKIKALIKLYKD